MCLKKQRNTFAPTLKYSLGAQLMRDSSRFIFYWRPNVYVSLSLPHMCWLDDKSGAHVPNLCRAEFNDQIYIRSYV